MIAEISDLLENDLGWSWVDTGDAETQFRVIYWVMTPDEGYTPEVRELYEVQLFIIERNTEKATQVAIQDASRLAFTHVSELLNANLVTSTTYTQDDAFDVRGPNVSLMFQTVTPRREWP